MEVGGAEGAGGLDVLALLDGEDLGADEAGVVDPAGESESEDEIREAGAEEGHDHDGKQDSGKGEEGVREIDVDEGVGEAAVKAGEHAEDGPQSEREGDDGDGDGEGDARSVEGAGEDVATEFVGAEPVCSGGRKKSGAEVEARGLVGSEPGSEDGGEKEKSEDDAAGESETLMGCALQQGTEP